jgi:hypothetical protein
MPARGRHAGGGLWDVAFQAIITTALINWLGLHQLTLSFKPVDQISGHGSHKASRKHERNNQDLEPFNLGLRFGHEEICTLPV